MMTSLVIDHPWFIYLSIALLSLCVGSLLNVIIYRLPIMLHAEWQEQCSTFLSLEPLKKEKPINLFFPRSFCPQCKSQVAAWHNIPLLSYLFLKGKCRFCQQAISIRYPLIELLTLLLSVYSLWHFGMTWQLPFMLVALWLLIILVFIDLDHQLLPDSITLTLLWLGLIANTHSLFTSLPNAVLSATGGYLFLWGFIRIFYLITGKIGMGNGDFKLFAAFGAWFGWIYLPFILLIASFIGAVVSIIYLRFTHQSKDTPIPFGPYLCLGGLITLFWGNQLILWYLKTWVHS